MYLVVIAWMYVVVLMTVAEATSAAGTLIGAFITFVLYGVLPLSVVMYLLYTPARRRAQAAGRRRALSGRGGSDPDGSGHASGDAVAAERKEA